MNATEEMACCKPEWSLERHLQTCGLTLRVLAALVHVSVTVQLTESDGAEVPTRCSTFVRKQAA